jgi:hypothetical protein
MKSTEQVLKTANDLSHSAKAKIAKKAKPASRKAATSAKRLSRAAKRPLREQSRFAGYSDSAARLISRGKTAFGDAYAWAGEASNALPRTTRDLGLPDQKSLKAMIDDKPLIIGAVGLGIGVALGSMLPSVGLSGKGKRAPERPSRRK